MTHSLLAIAEDGDNLGVQEDIFTAISFELCIAILRGKDPQVESYLIVTQNIFAEVILKRLLQTYR